MTPEKKALERQKAKMHMRMYRKSMPVDVKRKYHKKGYERMRKSRNKEKKPLL
jgi:hypothetical protein